VHSDCVRALLFVYSWRACYLVAACAQDGVVDDVESTDLDIFAALLVASPDAWCDAWLLTHLPHCPWLLAGQALTGLLWGCVVNVAITITCLHCHYVRWGCLCGCVARVLLAWMLVR